MRLLVGLEQFADAEFGVRLLNFDVVEIPRKVKRGVRLPELEDHVDALDGHQPLRLGVGQIKKAPVGGDAALAETAVEAAFGQVVEKGQPHRDIDRVVLRHDGDARAQADVLRQGQDVGDKEVVGRNRLPSDSVMLADPSLGEAELVGADDELDVLGKAFSAVFFRGMQGHHKGAEFHGNPPLRAM